MDGIIEQYTKEISRMKIDLESAKRDLAYYTSQKRLARPSARGRIANDNWTARLGVAQYDVRIAAAQAKIAMYKNQIKLREDTIKEERAKIKKAKSSKPTAKTVKTVKTDKATKPTTKKTAAKPAPVKKVAPAVKKTADGKIDRRTKEGKAIANRMVKARAAKDKKAKKK